MPLCGFGKSSGLSGRKPIPRKIVVCGDGAVGKTSLCNVFTRGTFIQVYEPTVFENYVQDIEIDEQTVEMSIWDTAGQEEFDRLRSLSYAETHVVMLCFSVDNPTSLENIEGKWVDEVLEYCPGVKLVLVACKCDMREDSGAIERLSKVEKHPVQYEEGLAVARRIRASRYLECSAKHNRGVFEVFKESARVSITARAQGVGTPPNSEGGCTIM